MSAARHITKRTALSFRTRPMIKTTLHLALATACLAALPSHAAEAYANYDVFSGTQIDDTRWLATERMRVIKPGLLYTNQRDLGSQTSDSGYITFSQSTEFDEPARVKQMSASINVTNWDVQGCASNLDSVTSARARIIGSFFNAGPRTEGSQLNDVFAQARVYRDSASTDASGVLRVQGYVNICTASDCSVSTTIGSADMGTTSLGQAVKLRVDWDQANKRFIFTRDALAPGLAYKNLQTYTSLANCFSGPRTSARIDANFDNVAVNASAAP